jgi:hypothetical protein
MRLEVPAHWKSGRMKDWRWWAGDGDETTTIYVRAESLDLRDKTDGAESRPIVNAEPYVAQTVAFLRTIPLAGEIQIDRIQSGYVVHAVADYEEDGESLRTYRGYSIMGRSEYVTCARLVLSTSAERTDDATVAWLFEHFRRQMHEIDIFARSPDTSDPLALKDLSVDDLFGIRIPDDWAHDISERNGLRSIWCYPRDPRLGKLAIAYEHKQLWPEFAEGRSPDITNKLADLRDDGFAEDDERRRITRARSAAPLGVVLYFVDDEKPRPYADADDVDRLYVRHHQWFYIIAGQQDSLVAFFNLKMPLRWINRPETAEVIALMDREIKALRLLPMFDR